MNFEKQNNEEGLINGVENKVSESPHLDEKLYSRFVELFFDDYDYLAGDGEKREKTKTTFLEGETENPTLDYPKLETFDFDTREAGLLELKEEALQHENHIVAQTYRWRINEMLAQLRMLKAAHDGNDRKFSRYSKFVYGEPSSDMFEYDKATLQHVITEALKSEDKERIVAANTLQDMLDTENSVSSRESYLSAPSEEAGERLDTEQIRVMFENAINNLDLSNWKVVIDQTGSRTGVSASQETKTVHLPKKATRTEKQVRALIAHELGTHAKRREQGERSKLQLLGLGLDRYLKGEEGVATYEQQKITGADDYAGFSGHMASSLACGLDGKKRDFRQVFEIMKQYAVAYIKDSKGEDREKRAENSSWGTCVRTFRGSSCDVPGAVFTKDIVYREGNIGVYELIDSESEEQHRFMAGKYDPTNGRHIWVLDQLGITEEDLNKTEEGE